MSGKGGIERSRSYRESISRGVWPGNLYRGCISLLTNPINCGFRCPGKADREMRFPVPGWVIRLYSPVAIRKSQSRILLGYVLVAQLELAVC